MKLFAINETEWIAAKTQEEAIEFLGLEPDEVWAIEEIPEEEWDGEVEFYTLKFPTEQLESEVPRTSTATIRELMQSATEKGQPRKIMSEEL